MINLNSKKKVKVSDFMPHFKESEEPEGEDTGSIDDVRALLTSLARPKPRLKAKGRK